MKKLKLKNPYNIRHYYNNDINKIISIFNERGYEMDADLAVMTWEIFSDSYAAGWLTLKSYTDDEIFNECMFYLEELND